MARGPPVVPRGRGPGPARGRPMPPGRGGPPSEEIARLKNALEQANQKIASLEKKVADLQKENAELKGEPIPEPTPAPKEDKPAPAAEPEPEKKPEPEPEKKPEKPEPTRTGPPVQPRRAPFQRPGPPGRPGRGPADPSRRPPGRGPMRRPPGPGGRGPGPDPRRAPGPDRRPPGPDRRPPGAAGRPGPGSRPPGRPAGGPGPQRPPGRINRPPLNTAAKPVKKEVVKGDADKFAALRAQAAASFAQPGPAAGRVPGIGRAIIPGMRPPTAASRTKSSEEVSGDYICKVKALYDYDAEEDNELTFKENDIVTVVSKDDSGWWTGRLGDAEGLFPDNFVEEIPDSGPSKPAESAPPAASESKETAPAKEPEPQPEPAKEPEPVKQPEPTPEPAKTPAPAPAAATSGKKVLFTVVAMYDYDAEEDNELSFKEHDIIDVHDDDESGWWAGTIQGTDKSGLFPDNFVEKRDASSSAPPAEAPAATESSDSGKKVLFQVKALYDYDKEEDNELSYVEGDIIDVIDTDDSGWWTGTLKGETGLFADNYVEKL